MANDIFISYRRKGGKEVAKHLHDLLIRDGYSVSFDMKSLRKGNFDTALLKLIDECTDFILILNKTAFDRCFDPTYNPKDDWMRTELSYALKQGKNIIPVMLEDFTGFPQNLPTDIAGVARKNGINYNVEYFDSIYKGLKKDYLETPTPILAHLRNYGKVALGVAVIIALIWGYSKFSHLSDIKENQDTQSPVEVVDAAIDPAENPQANVKNSTSLSSKNRESLKNLNANTASDYSQNQEKSSPTEVSQPVSAPTQTVIQSEPTVKEPAVTPVELSASELLSKGKSAVKKFKADQGAEYFKQAIAKGSVEANYYLGELYYTGNGVAKSFPTAKSYFQKAAQAGMADAQYMMGVMYRNGQGGDKDLDQAKSWLQKAASQGNANAERLLNQLK